MFKTWGLSYSNYQATTILYQFLDIYRMFLDDPNNYKPSRPNDDKTHATTRP